MTKIEQLAKERIQEMSLIDLCFEYMLENKLEKLNVYDFLDYIKPLRDVDDEEFSNQAAYFYTDLNLDGRFVCIEDGSWVLRDNLLIEDIKNYVEPSVQKYDDNYEDEDLIEEELDDEVLDEIDELVEEEDDDESTDELYEFSDDGIVSKFTVQSEDEEF